MSEFVMVKRELLDVIANSSERTLAEINDAIQQARAVLAQEADADKVNNRQMGMLQFVDKHGTGQVEVPRGMVEPEYIGLNVCVSCSGRFGELKTSSCALLSKAYYVKCASCGATTSGYDKAAPAVKEWNSRSKLADDAPLYTSPPAPVAVPEGWKLVPIEPTELMIRRGDQNYSWSVAKIYAAMIADAPACLDKVKELNK